MSHTGDPSVHTFFFQVFIAMSHWSDSRLLASATPLILGSHWGSFCIFCHCLMLWRFCSFGSAGLAPSLLYQFINEVDVGVGQLTALVLGLASSWIGHSTSSPSSSPWWQALQPRPTSSHNAVDSKASGPLLLLSFPQGWLTCTSFNRVSATVLPRQSVGSTLLSSAASEG